jgi:hypothetical protein
MKASAPNGRASSSRSGRRSTTSTLRAPRALARLAWRQPIGPAPRTMTSSSGPTSSSSCPLITQARGSASAASVELSPPGTALTHPARTAEAGTAMYSAKPPSNW